MANQHNTAPFFFNCATCGKKVRAKAYKATTAKYCSRACQGGTHIKHGDARRSARAPEHAIWSAMLDRCRNPENKFFLDYGGRGIAVCEAWHSYERFIADVGKRPPDKRSIDRIDNDLGYEPGNVQWSTDREQQRNKKDTVYLTVDSITRPRIEWAEVTGVAHETIRSRLRIGWTVKQALGMIAPPKRTRRPAGQRATGGAGGAVTVPCGT